MRMLYKSGTGIRLAVNFSIISFFFVLDKINTSNIFSFEIEGVKNG